MGQTKGKPESENSLESGETKLIRKTEGYVEKDKEISDASGFKVGVLIRRWFILGLFCIFSLINAYQWIHLSIIGNVLLQYYNASLPANSYWQELSIDWLSMIYMLVYIPLIFPASWLLDKKGLRTVVILGTLLNCLGAWLKCFSVSPDRFWLLITAQTICGIAQLCILEVPPRLAAVWFGPNEVSTATSIGVFGNQVGVALGFLIPPMIVTDDEDLDAIGHNLSEMFYGTAGFATAIFLLCLFVFQKQPPHPPSRAQMLALEVASSENYFKSLIQLFKNTNYIILMITYGMNTGSYYAISTLLNTVFLHYFQGEEVSAGRIGLTIILAGVLGSVVAGIWLDRTKTFKGTTVAMYIFSLAGMVAFTFTLDVGELWVVYLTSGSLGFFMTGYLPVGFEFAVEITFPEPEGTSSGLLNASAQVFGIILTIVMRTLINKLSVLGANLAVSIFLLVGATLTVFIKADYRRQKAEKQVIARLDNIEIEIPEKDKGESTCNQKQTQPP